MQIQSSARAEFQNTARQVVSNINSPLQRNIDILHALKGLISDAPAISRLQFKRFIDGLELAKHYPGIQAVEFIRRVRDVNKNNFIAQVRNDRSLDSAGYPNFDIRPPGKRDEYYVIEFVEPMAGNLSAFGYDIAVLETPSAAAQAARDRGEAVLTGRYRLIQEQETSIGLVAYLPIYSGKPETAAEKRAALVGFVNVVFRLEDLFKNVRGSSSFSSLRLRLYDAGPAQDRSVPAVGANLLFDSLGDGWAETAGAAHTPQYQYEHLQQIAGRNWALKFESTEAFGNPWLQALPLLAFFAGMIISLLVFLVLLTLSNSRRDAMRLAQEATRGSRDQLKFTEQLLEVMPNPVFYKDAGGHYLGCNRAFEDYIGYKRGDLIGKTVYDIAPADLANRYSAADKALFDNPGTQIYEASVLYARSSLRREVIFYKATFSKSDGSVAGLVGTIIDISEKKRLEQTILENNEMLNAIIRSTPAAVISRDANRVIQFWNPAAERMFGWTASEVVGTDTTILPERLRAETVALRQRAENGEIILLEETRRLRRDGSEIDVSLSISPIYGAGNQLKGTLVVINDIGPRIRAERALRESEAHLRLAVHAAQMATWHWDIASDQMYCSSGMYQLLGLPEETARLDYRSLHERLHPDDVPMVARMTRELVKQSKDFQMDFRIIWPDGSLHWLSVRGHVYRREDGWATRVIGVAMNITDRKQTEERIAFIANHDALTGLPNRILLRDRLGQAIAQAHRNGVQVALLFIDLDRFKTINDSLGHTAGDHLLQSVSSRIKTYLREGDTVSRLGGDEFVIVLQETDAGGAAAVAAKLLELLSEPYHIDHHDLHISASIGICLYPNDGKEADTLLRNADAAMYHAKERGRANYQFFTDHMNVSAQKRLRMDTDLRNAIEHEEFELVYQPVFSIADRKLTGVEALLRWHHPEKGLVFPGEFIGYAEDSGLIAPIGEWVLNQVCSQMISWRKRGLNFRVAVNVSAQQLRYRNFLHFLKTLLRESAIDPDLLVLEITESLLVGDSSEASSTLGLLDELGVRLAVDDFGTGYSGLSYLKRFPIDAVKIDRSFIRDIHTDPDDKAIVRAIVTMAKSLDLAVVAEGVETREQLEFLNTLSCDMAQGYFLGMPMDIETLENFLQNPLPAS